MALRLVKPITRGLADNFLSQLGDIAVCNVNKLLQGCGVTEVSEMEAETFSQHLCREQRQWFRKIGEIGNTCVLHAMNG